MTIESEIHKKSSLSSENNTNAVIGIIGAGVFFFLTVIVSFLKVLGGFLSWNVTEGLFIGTFDFYWDKMTVTVLFISVGIGYDDFESLESLGIESNLEIIWTILPLWGLVFLGLGFLGAVLVVIPPLMKLGNAQPIEAPLGLIGLIAGLVATGVEYGLFLLLWLLEDWGEQAPNINIILLGSFIIGWIALIIGYYFSTKISESSVYSPVTPSKPTTLTISDKYDSQSSIKYAPKCSNPNKSISNFCETCENSL